MHYLELKVPPVVLVLVAAMLMTFVASLTPSLIVTTPLTTLVALIWGVASLSVGFIGVYTFKKAKTTVDPTQPNKASSLVSHGIYRYTRNPMYLGLASGLVSIAIYWGNLYCLLIVPIFIAYMNRFQIEAEERVLQQLFGKAYREYQQHVRRWM